MLGPKRYSPALQMSPAAAGGKAGGIRFALYQLFSGKFQNDAAIRCWGNKGIVLFCSNAGHGLEPMGIVRCALFNSPGFHRVGHSPGDFRIQRLAVAYRLFKSPVDILGSFSRIAESPKTILPKISEISAIPYPPCVIKNFYEKRRNRISLQRLCCL